MPAIRRVVILGGGVAGWMSALALSRALAGSGITLELVKVEVPDHSIGPFGGVEASLPAFHHFLGDFGLDEDALLRAGKGTYALGTAFTGWSGPRDGWFLPFGDIGAPIGSVAFPHLVSRLRAAGHPVRSTDFSLAAVAAAAGRFVHPSEDPASVLSSYGYGLNLDLAALAAACRAEAHDVHCHDAPFASVERAPGGQVSALVLEGGDRVPGDLFLDCSGPAALLSWGHGFESWSEWLPCNRVIARRSAQEGVPPPYSHAGAHPAGWMRSVPLAGGPGEALIYASAHLSDDEAGGSGAMPVAFAQGRRARAWMDNVIAIGAAAMLVEPLYGHNLQMVHRAIRRLIDLFPNSADGPEAREYNRLTAAEADRVRDFVIAHYKTNGRVGEPFWDAARAMPVPDELQYKLDLFASRGRMPIYDEELFDRPEWIAMLDGQGVHPRRYDALAESIPEPAIIQHVTRLRELIVQAARAMPGHGAALSRVAGA